MELAAPATTAQELPVAVIGAGPVGLAAAAQLIERGLRPLIFEAGPEPAAAVRSWGHIRLFSPWRYNIDAAARRLLEAAGWQAPDPDTTPTGAELVDRYLVPLARLAPLATALKLNTRVTAVTRLGLDRTQSADREQRPFLIRTVDSRGIDAEHLAGAVIDASGTWHTPNPAGGSGLPAPGEAEARAMGLVSGPLPDVLGTEHDRFAGRRVLVTGSGHSAANTLLALAELADSDGGRISWAVRGTGTGRLFGGGEQDGLPARGALGQRLKALVESGRIELHTGFTVTGFKAADTLLVSGRTAGGEEQLEVDVLVPATGFRPDHSWLREIRLDLDPVVEAPSRLGPMIDPEFHSCGTVPPHGARVLSHLERDFYIAGAKSYGRAPTFLLATGYEQVRSIAAELAGDSAAADEVHLALPETGVCSSDPAPASTAGGCCAPGPAQLGLPTGLKHGRSGDDAGAGC